MIFFLSYLFIYSVLRFHILLRLSMLLITQGVGCTTLDHPGYTGLESTKRILYFLFVSYLRKCSRRIPLCLCLVLLPVRHGLVCVHRAVCVLASRGQTGM
ncbi:uncharacterized protein BO96DRAFT_98442 [Aspergillus niger CBS 101883]|uniref:uncharacterized protein n=1 Tax=Aspergillus lacticoffeatus (strain CBS 101883) TaxID=1450533 RepID=UPI000D804F0B|nr:uncharacterized protein BO96DRAFT_98442 [Aspergillus niger CBS 101883]PYH61498.1 hypothetical protein BO96DRAFT_98442 [Aspergillus niger CBS 101883]